jgi:flagellar biosynthesis protein FlhF
LGLETWDREQAQSPEPRAQGQQAQSPEAGARGQQAQSPEPRAQDASQPPSRWSKAEAAPLPGSGPQAPGTGEAPLFHELLAGQMNPAPAQVPAERPAIMPRPWFVALVGPTGAGKTTTIAKLATSAQGFAGCRVGLLGLDTYRVGAAEQLSTYAELAGLPCEIVYSDAELASALKRLSDCEVVLVDTPGRGPRNADDAEIIRKWLGIIAPDEVHLALPAGQLPAVSRRMLRAFASFRCTHLIATKLDEYPAESGVFDLALEHAHPMRWVTDGQEVPADLRSAAELLSAARERRRASVRNFEPAA